VTTQERRAVVTAVQGRDGVRERYRGRALGVERTALRYQPIRPARDAPLRARLRELAGAHPRWGVPRLHWRLGQPVRLSLDNGCEFRSRAFDAWAADRGIELCVIQPGKPVQNAFIESVNGKLRDECLNPHGFLSLRDAQFHVERWRREYNTDRPHQPCFPLTPTEYTRTFVSPTARLSA